MADAGTTYYGDGRRYDAEYRDRTQDVAAYVRVAAERAKGLILELGCGTGRVTKALVEAGHTVVAVDNSEAMLARAREQVSCELVAADMRDFDLGRKFQMVVAPFGVFEHLHTPEDIASCFECIRRHLTPGGILAFDVEVPDMAYLSMADWRWGERPVPEDVGNLCLTRATYDEALQLERTEVMFFDANGRTVTQLVQRKFFPAELRALVLAHGFEIVAHTGMDGAPLGEGDRSGFQMILCQGSR